MIGWLLSRLLRAAITLLAVLTFAFVVLRLSGDPALMILSADAPPEAIAAFRQGWGLDAPLWKQYLGYLGNLLQGNFGRSMRDGGGALSLLWERLPATLMIALPALLLKILIGVPAGVYAALHRNRFVDRLVMGLSVAGYTVPSFVLGLVLVLLFAVRWGWLPSGGYVDGDWGWRHAILPIVTLSLGGAAVLARFTRSATIEVLSQPYVRTARAKGLRWPAVVRHHVLPNAAIPTLTVIGFMLGSLLAGAVVVESVFSWPGVGRLLVSAVANRDLAVVQAVLLMVAVSMISANLIVDMLYGWIDPRLRASASGARS